MVAFLEPQRDDAPDDAPDDARVVPLGAGAPPELGPAVYAELRRIAGRFMRRERPDAVPSVEDPAFVAVAARAMRHVLVDHARRRSAQKRSMPLGPSAAEQAATERSSDSPLEVLAIDDALRQLATLAPRAAKVVELRFFAGLEIEEVGAALGISPATVKRDWILARAWLRRALDAAVTDAPAGAGPG